MPRSSHFYIVFPLKKSFAKYNVQNKSFICRQNWHLNVETIYMLYISVYSMQRKNRCQSWKSRANRNKCRLERPCEKSNENNFPFFRRRYQNRTPQIQGFRRTKDWREYFGFVHRATRDQQYHRQLWQPLPQLRPLMEIPMPLFNPYPRRPFPSSNASDWERVNSEFTETETRFLNSICVFRSRNTCSITWSKIAKCGHFARHACLYK